MRLSFEVGELSSSSTSCSSSSLPIVMFDLPCKNDVLRECLSEGGGELMLQPLFERFVGLVNQFQDLWDAFEDIDRNCWVIEPEHPSRSCAFRRVVVEKNCTMEIHLNPDQCFTASGCMCRFYGSPSVLHPLMALFDQRKELVWDSKRSPRLNIEDALQLKLPSKLIQNTAEFGLECGICYSFKLNDVCSSFHGLFSYLSGFLFRLLQTKSVIIQCVRDHFIDSVCSSG
eukprot:TRINITY_DN17420_c0_g1_i2.p1 TRINITY_DN17420_c0_g1~~TRINITY_DN17420_c0_g1_i2.p1  ORF type:complete len:229 (+),score=63.36 TRINITY_DN17420_c0_g1_i2:285-971(+)